MWRQSAGFVCACPCGLCTHKSRVLGSLRTKVLLLLCQYCLCLVGLSLGEYETRLSYAHLRSLRYTWNWSERRISVPRMSLDSHVSDRQINLVCRRATRLCNAINLLRFWSTDLTLLVFKSIPWIRLRSAIYSYCVLFSTSCPALRQLAYVMQC